jgi:rfaE bifunctional protein kinase chain/domain
MSNPLDSNKPSSSDKPEEKPVKPLDAAEKPATSFSISDLLSMKSQLGQGSSLSTSDTGNFGTPDLTLESAAQPRFDGLRTIDLSRFLSDKNIARDLSKTPSIQNDGKDFTWQTTHMLDANANMGLTIPLGLRQHFQLRGVDAKGIEEQKRLDELKLRLAELNGNSVNNELIITEETRRSLEEATVAAKRSNSIPELVSNSLNLARILEYIGYIEDARKAIMIASSADPKNQLAHQMLQELERVHPQDIAFAPITAPAPELTKSNLAKRIIDLSRGSIAVVGDLLIDELLEANPTRISREAPVLILEHADTEHIPGGAANTAHNITAFGAKCHAIGVCGDDDYSEKLAKMLERHGITHDLVKDPSRPTTVKTRILSKSHSLMQQLLRLDRISHEKISEDIARRLAGKIIDSTGSCSAIILSDYKAGVIVDSVVEACRKVSSERKILLIVDAQNDFKRFAGSTLITPNQPDSEEAVGYKIDSRQTLERAGADLLAQSRAEAVLLTRGSHGMALFRRHDGLVELPPFNKSEVFDVTGAGDTVVATMALALVTGASFVEAMALGNLAAGIVVKKVGTAVTSQKEMLDTLETISMFK